MQRFSQWLGEHFLRLEAIAEGLLVAMILGSSLVFVKIALVDLGPLTILAFRYVFACALLLPPVLYRRHLTGWSPQLWKRFLFIGLSFYVIGNGTLVLGVRYLPATTASLLLSFIPLLVLCAGLLWLKEVPTRGQLAGVLVNLVGCCLFFSSGFQPIELLGIGIIVLGLVGNAAYGVAGRDLARQQRVDTLALTALPLTVGAAILLPLAFVFEGIPRFDGWTWGIVVVLAVIHTAGVYLLYNHALRVLAAFEMSVLVNLAPLATVLWAWILLGEQVSIIQLLGMVIVIVGAVLVQKGKSSQTPGENEK
ncbi:MAG TPA: EamA family transporter [Ktedonobacteraceae bacterium]|jgi:drug/metabolite transporter (DMT)-like permease|nr:EamA family transporter [Ktedonobacteraceae bacterium]